MSNQLATPSENLYPPNTYPTDLDLSGKWGYGGKFSSGKIVLSASQGERVEGVIRQSTPSTATDHGVEMACTPGQSVVMIAGANGISARGDEVTADGAGLWESAASSDVVVGHADRAAASGELFVCYLTHFYVK